MNFFSQFGEDRHIYENLLKLGLKKNKGIFIDVGAGDPKRYSNSYFFECLGYDTYCLEPDARHYKKFKGVRAKYYPLGVSSVEGMRPFFLDNKEDLSTLNRVGGRKYTTQQTKFIRLDSFLALQNIKTIDILDIDTEGTELDVLKSFNINKVKPKVIIVEYYSINQNHENEIADFFKKLPYKLVHRTNANLIYCLDKKL